MLRPERTRSPRAVEVADATFHFLEVRATSGGEVEVFRLVAANDIEAEAGFLRVAVAGGNLDVFIVLRNWRWRRTARNWVGAEIERLHHHIDMPDRNVRDRVPAIGDVGRESRLLTARTDERDSSVGKRLGIELHFTGHASQSTATTGEKHEQPRQRREEQPPHGINPGEKEARRDCLAGWKKLNVRN